ncbi:hypothetical protein B0T17DRAFT_517621 [Bombardia bombarda]|uniref:UBX domain-containing protein 1 n=1 Tax=Bombardia bombarda TaxID=252184 RepID=A0AA40CF33_9PEZI|nr:hypothetical protein B0T17DRAFT_517621 [Bombardia bombarda]
MAQTDLQVLLEMGFEQARAELAIKKTGGLQGALNWLEETQDTPLEELQKAQAAADASKDDDEDEETGPSIAPLEGEKAAKSLVCNECGKKFRNNELASYHASKTDHTDFSESTDEIAPLTEEEKKARLEDLRQKMLEKKAKQALEEKEEAKRNEKIRQKSTREVQDLKEELARKEQAKEAEKKRQEKSHRPPTAPQVAAPKATVNHAEARLRLQTSKGNIIKLFPAETTLFEVAQAIEAENGQAVQSFSTTFPRKTYESGVDFGQTLKEAGLVPSAVLIVK